MRGNNSEAERVYGDFAAVYAHIKVFPAAFNLRVFAYNQPAAILDRVNTPKRKISADTFDTHRRGVKFFDILDKFVHLITPFFSLYSENGFLSIKGPAEKRDFFQYFTITLYFLSQNSIWRKYA